MIKDFNSHQDITRGTEAVKYLKIITIQSAAKYPLGFLGKGTPRMHSEWLSKMQTAGSQHYQEEHFHLGHFSAVFFVALLLVGVSWLKNPELFNLNKNSQTLASTTDVPKYYAYVVPAEDQIPLVAGATTQDQGPSIINEDGTISPALDSGSVLGAFTDASSTHISLDEVTVNGIPDSQPRIQAYTDTAKKIENGYIDNTEFETALTSSNQGLIDKEAAKLSDVKNNLQKLSVPSSFVKFHKLKLVQYSAAIGLLTNFTDSAKNPQLVGDYLNQFLSTQQQLSNEGAALEKKYNIDLGYPAGDGSELVSTVQVPSEPIR